MHVARTERSGEGGSIDTSQCSPVVEVLVGDDPLNALVVRVGGRLGPRQHEGRVEDVQALR